MIYQGNCHYSATKFEVEAPNEADGIIYAK